jgi:hypothetical protein
VEKDQKVRKLVDTIKLSQQQGRIEGNSKKMSRNLLLRTRLEKLADMLVELLGGRGMCFIAPMDIAENQALASASKIKTRFLTYIWSITAKKMLKEMGEDLSASPMLEKAPIFQYVLDSRMPYSADIKMLNLPKKHPPMTSALLIPIVIDNKSLGLVGLANANATEQDIEVLFQSLPNAWMSIITESVRDSSNSILSNTLPSFVLDQLMSESTNRSRPGSSAGCGPLIANKHDEGIATEFHI